MFQVGDYIIYGGNNVCKVIDVGTPDLGLEEKKTQYYTLQPVYERESTIYTPVNNDKVVMRKIISAEEAKALISDISSIEVLEVKDENGIFEKYKEAMNKYDCRELIRIIKTSYLRKEDRIANGKKGTSTDDKYLKLSEEYLFGELAISLSMTRDEVKDFIMEQVNQEQNSEEEIS